jgi:hypothetical protein
MGAYGDFMKWTGGVMVGVGGALAGAGIGAAATGAGAAATIPLVTDGVILIGLGNALMIHGDNANAKEAAEERSKSDGAPVPTVITVPTTVIESTKSSSKTITVSPVIITGGNKSTITVPPVVIEDDTPPPDDVPDDEPRPGDLYPDPDGGGGGDPTMIWDENGGGGQPNTIWDENFGGDGPTVRPIATLVSNALVGPGMLAQFTQVGRRVIIY